jgi:hypothetical protein
MNHDPLIFRTASWTLESRRVNAAGHTTETTISNVWVKGEKTRAHRFLKVFDGTRSSLRLLTILISDGHSQYSYRPPESKVVKIPRGYEAEELARKWVTQKCEEHIGFEFFDGKPCQIFWVINEVDLGGLLNVRVEVKEWRWRGFILKSVTQTDGSPDGDTRIIVVGGLRLDTAIPDAFFELPAGVRIVEWESIHG